MWGESQMILKRKLVKILQKNTEEKEFEAFSGHSARLEIRRPEILVAVKLKRAALLRDALRMNGDGFTNGRRMKRSVTRSANFRMQYN